MNVEFQQFTEGSRHAHYRHAGTDQVQGVCTGTGDAICTANRVAFDQQSVEVRNSATFREILDAMLTQMGFAV